MPVEVIMPKVDMDMASGKVAVWHVTSGDWVEKGAPLFDIETDKAAMEVEAPASGLLHHPVAEGSTVGIGAPVAWLYAKDEAVGPAPGKPAPAEAAVPEAVAVAVDQLLTEAAEKAGVQSQRATPLARKIARESGVALVEVAGSGPRGRVQAADVRALLGKAEVPVAAPVAEAPVVEVRVPVASVPAAPASFVTETGALAVSRSRGGTGQPIVLIHGFASDSQSWAPLEAHLRDRPLIRIDLPAHGKSPRLKTTSFTDLVLHLRRALDGLDIERADVIGHSLGGALSLALADTRPRTVASLTLIAPAGLGPEINGAALAGICRATRPESLAPWLRTLVADPSLITEAYARIAMAAREDEGLRAAQAALADVVFPDGVQSFDLRAALDRVTVPTRIFWGRQDAIISWRHVLHAPGRVALHLFDRTGHMPQFEIAGELGPLLRSALSGA